MTPSFRIPLWICASCLVCGALAAGLVRRAGPSARGRAPAAANQARRPVPPATQIVLPTVFEANGEDFVARTRSGLVRISQQGVRVWQQGGPELSLDFAGGREVKPRGEGPPETRFNYFIGSDPARWKRNLPGYRRVLLPAIYSGVDAVFYGKEGQLEFDLLLSPGASLDAVRLRYTTATAISVDQGGNAIVKVGEDTYEQRLPRVFQEDANGGFEELPARYQQAGSHELAFDVPGRDPTRRLRVDPTLLYSTYLGGSGKDSATGVAVDASGSVYVTGQTTSPDFPYASGPYTPDGGQQAVFVVKLDPTGTRLEYATHLGGSISSGSASQGIAVDSAGAVYVGGQTMAADFPTTPGAFIPKMPGSPFSGFVSKLDPTGSQLLYSTFLGGTVADAVTSVAVDSSGQAAVTGYTNSPDFPVLNPLQPYGGNPDDAFVAKLNSSGSGLVFSTYLGGGNLDEGLAIAEDGSDNLYVAGITGSYNFPVRNAFQTALKANPATDWNAFVAKLTSAGALVYSTYLGGSSRDSAYGIAVDPSGRATVVGQALSLDFPTANAFQATNLSGTGAFVTQLDPTGGSLVWSTFLGGHRYDSATGVAADNAGNVYVTGATSDSDFPLANPIQSTNGGSASDGFVAAFDPLGHLSFGSYLGGSGLDFPSAITASSTGEVWVVGSTSSGNFPTVNPEQAQLRGAGNAFVTKLSHPSGLASTIPHYTVGCTCQAAGTGDLLWLLPALCVLWARRSRRSRAETC